MKNESYFIVLTLLLLASFIRTNYSNVDFVLAQDNTIGQEGEDNDASQSELSSQETNQNSMCVSGDSASLSCNNLSSESIDPQTGDGEQSPISIQGMIYQKSNSDTEDEGIYLATVSCEPGDTAISSNFNLDDLGNSPITQLTNTLDLSNNQATLEIETDREDAIITVYINCFDNP